LACGDIWISPPTLHSYSHHVDLFQINFTLKLLM